MTRSQAQREAGKRWGKKALISASESISSPERRARAVQERDSAKQRMEDIEREIKDRLAQLVWYQSLMQERRRLRADIERARGEAVFYKFSVGRDTGFAFCVEGHGDTWAEAFADVDQRDARERQKRGAQ